MRFRVWFMWLLAALISGEGANASDIMIHDGETVTVLVNDKTGTLVEFPVPVKVVAPRSHFDIEEVGTKVDKSTGQVVNVSIVHVKARSRGSQETVPFILAGGQSVNLRFIAAIDAAKHRRIRFPKKSRGSMLGGQFLEKETELMTLMLRDEEGAGFSKTVLYESLKIDGYDDLEMAILRRFEGSGLFGYTFKIVNKSAEKKTINPASLNFGSPNHATLLQIDHETLEPCSVNNSPDPREPSCMTVLRLIVRGEDFVYPSSQPDLPFQVRKE